MAAMSGVLILPRSFRLQQPPPREIFDIETCEFERHCEESSVTDQLTSWDISDVPSYLTLPHVRRLAMLAVSLFERVHDILVISSADASHSIRLERNALRDDPACLLCHLIIL
jgi:hypothetical protein